MCLGNFVKGIDNLDRPVLDTNYMRPDNDNCDYIDYHEKQVSINNLDLSVIHINVRGLASKIDDLTRLVRNCTNIGEVDIVFISETWLNPFSPNVEIPGYTLVHEDRKAKKGGGVGIYVNKKLKFNRLEELTCSNAECCGIELLIGTKRLVLVSLYRPPNGIAATFNKSFKHMVDAWKWENKYVIIGTDHNLDLLKTEKHPQTQTFLEKVFTCRLLPMITRPTRITKSTATLIDNILVDQTLTLNSFCSVLIDNISDHLPCLVVLKDLKVKPNSKVTITSRDTRKRSLDQLKIALGNCDWYPETIESQDLNTKATHFHNKLTELVNYHCPLQTRSVKYKAIRREPWLSAGLHKSLKKCKSLYKSTLKLNCCNQVLEHYKLYNSTLQRLKRTSKVSYYNEMCTKYKSSTKQLWKIVNDVIATTNDKTNIIDCLKVDNVKTYNPRVIANTFGDYFATVGKKFAKKIRQSKESIDNFIAKVERNEKSLFLTPTCSQEIRRLIMNLPNKTSSGFDNISNVMLKEICPYIETRLADLYNQSMTEGIFPEIMKEAEVVPLYKGKSPLEVTNYRPISLLLTISKILEKLIYGRTYSFLMETNQLFVSQYGFRANHACDHAISELLSEIIKNQQLGKYTVGIFLDLSKAFDTLEHSVIFSKLDKYGIRGKVLQWFRSYLTDRKLSVKCPSKDNHDIKSPSYNVEYGTPQGSCLGPLIFLIFCNDLHLNMTFLACIQFADDTSLHKSHYNLQYLRFCVEHDIDSLQDWFRANKLTLNVQKSVCMLFTPNGKHLTFELEFDDQIMPQVRSTKLLGVWIDDQLNWHEHINKILLKLKAKIHMLCKGKTLLSIHAKRILYFAQIQSHLTYGLVCWGNMIDSSDLNRLRKMQNACVRLIDSTKPLERIYYDHKILTIDQLIILENAKLWYKFYKNLLPQRLHENMMVDHHQISLQKQHRYATRNKQELNIPRAQHKKYRDSFLVKGLLNYQSLPRCIKNVDKLHKFVKQCKDKLLNK